MYVCMDNAMRTIRARSKDTLLQSIRDLHDATCACILPATVLLHLNVSLYNAYACACTNLHACVCVGSCVRACVRALLRSRVRMIRIRVCVRACVCVCVRLCRWMRVSIGRASNFRYTGTYARVWARIHKSFLSSGFI